MCVCKRVCLEWGGGGGKPDTTRRLVSRGEAYKRAENKIAKNWRRQETMTREKTSRQRGNAKARNRRKLRLIERYVPAKHGWCKQKTKQKQFLTEATRIMVNLELSTNVMCQPNCVQQTCHTDKIVHPQNTTHSPKKITGHCVL